MTIAAGSRIGRYVVLRALGAGGMGEVWSARDESLGREVAVKTLPEPLAHDPEHLSRWEREARLLASLNHPNIATVYGIEPVEGSHVLVLELIEGQTLAERIAEGPIPIPEALPIFCQVAAALEAAHDAGIVHRDLKPGNVMITPDGRVKVLDFGLAKPLAIMPRSTADEAPTLTQHPTEAGTVLGTPAYMSPEQARGRPVDRRTDAWAFGCTLYEALTGRHAFAGQTASDTLARVIEREPDWPALPGETPQLVRQLLRRCLRKEASTRQRDMGDARLQLEEAIAEPDSGGLTPPAASARPALWALIGFLLASAAAVLAWRAFGSARRPSGGGSSVVRFALRLPPDLGVVVYNSSSIAFSHDGARIAYAAHGKEGSSIWVRPLDALEAVRLSGTEGGRSPFFSANDDWIGFEGGQRLKRVAVTGGAAQSLSELPFPAGATDGPEGSIVFVPSFTAGLFQVPERGGRAQRLTTPDLSQREIGHTWPVAIGNGRGILYTIWKAGQPSYDQAAIGVYDFRSGRTSVVLEGGYAPRLTPNGFLLFVRGSAIHAAPFDLERLVVKAPAVRVVDDVFTDTSQGVALYDMSSTGSLAYVRGGEHRNARRLVSVDRSGAARTISDTGRSYVSPRVSPDGRSIALFIEEPDTSLYVLDPVRGALTRSSFGGDDHSPVWSPDGSRLAFESGREGFHQIYVRRADGTGGDARVTSGQMHHYLADWSRDGRWLAYVEFHPETGADLWVTSAEGDGVPRPLVRTPFSEREAAFSPDSRWLAYASDESGRFEIYVQPFPGPGKRLQISSEGGKEPAWSRDGTELFYRSGNRMLSVRVGSGMDLDPGSPVALFSGSYHSNIAPCRSYDVTPDGGFVMVTEPAGTELPQEIQVVLGWAGELARRAPAP